MSTDNGTFYLKCDDYWSSLIETSLSNTSTASIKGLALDVLVVSPESNRDRIIINIDNENNVKNNEEGEEVQAEKKQNANNIRYFENSNTPSATFVDNNNTRERDSNTTPSTRSDTSTGGIFASSDFYVKFTDFNQQLNCCKASQQHDFTILLQINNILIHPHFLSMSLPCMKHGHINNNQKNTTNNKVEKYNNAKSKENPISSSTKQICLFTQGRSTKPPTQVLQKLVHDGILIPGKNTIRYILASFINDDDSVFYNDVEKKGIHTDQTDQSLTEQQEEFTKNFFRKYNPIGVVSSCIYLWNVNDTVVVVDIDGTVTKSDVRGIISTILTENYDHVHSGVCDFFTNIVNYSYIDGITSNHYGIITDTDPATSLINESLQRNNNDDITGGDATMKEPIGDVRVVYLSSRPIQFIHSTRKFISQLSQSSVDEERDNNDNKSNTIQYFNCFNPPISLDDSDKYDYDSNKNNGEEVTLAMFQETNYGRASQSLNKLKRKDDSRLPQGPIFLHPGNLSNVLVSELVNKSIHEFKSDTLIRQIVLPFAAAGKKIDQSNIGAETNKLFVAGFGNKATDAKAYHLAGMRKKDIFIINKSSELVCVDHEYGNYSDETKKNIMIPNNENRHNYVRKQSFSGYDDPHLTKAMIKRIKEMMLAKKLDC